MENIKHRSQFYQRPCNYVAMLISSSIWTSRHYWSSGLWST